MFLENGLTRPLGAAVAMLNHGGKPRPLPSMGLVYLPILPKPFGGCFMGNVGKIYHRIHRWMLWARKNRLYMAGVQNSWSKGLYKVGTIGIEKLILHLRYEAGPIGNDAVHKLGASVALVELWYGEHCSVNMQRLVLKTFSDIIHCGVLHPLWFSTWVTRHPVLLWSQKGETQSEFCASTALASR